MTDTSFGIKRPEWIHALKQVIPTTGNVTGMQRFFQDCACFDREHVWTFNGEQALRLPLNSPIQGGVEAKVLLQVLSSYPSDDVFLFLENDGGTMLALNAAARAQGMKSKTVIPCIDEKEIAFTMPNVLYEDTKPLEVDANLVTGLRRVLVSVSKGESEDVQSSVTLTMKGPTPVLYSTDNTAMSRFYLAPKDSTKALCELGPLMLPRRFVERIIQMFDSTEKPEGDKDTRFFPMEVIIKHDKPVSAMVDFNGAVLFSLLPLDVEPIIYEKVFDAVLPDTAPQSQPIPDGFEKILDRAMVLQQTNHDKKVRLVGDGTTLKVTFSGPSGAMEDMVSLEHGIDPPIDISAYTAPLKRACGINHQVSLLKTCFGFFDGPFSHLVSYYAM